MPVSAKIIADKPIVVLTFPADARAQHVSVAYLRGLEYVAHLSGPVYWLVDIRSAVKSYASVMAALKELVMGVAGAPVMPAINMAFIALPSMKGAFDDTFGPSDDLIGFFTDYDTAAAFAHARTGSSLVAQ